MTAWEAMYKGLDGCISWSDKPGYFAIDGPGTPCTSRSCRAAAAARPWPNLRHSSRSYTH